MDLPAHHNRHKKTASAAKSILSLARDAIPPGVERVLDVGCGVGTWLADFIDRGIDPDGLLGLDVHHYNEQMVIPRVCYEQSDLSTPMLPWALRMPFHLVICLEFAEHIARDKAAKLVQLLCEASNYVLFSAAIPGQGGVGHLNEQWQSYWQTMFAMHSFVQYDIFRRLIWERQHIPVWYRQNLFLYAQKSAPVYLSEVSLKYLSMPANVVHPELFTSKRK